MGRKYRFVKPEMERLELSGGDWIEIKKRLNVGELRKMQLGGLSMKAQPGSGDMEMVANMEQFGMAKVRAYLLDWNLVDENEKPIPYTEDALSGLGEADYNEIETAINEYTEALEKADQEGKKTTKGTTRRSRAT